MGCTLNYYNFADEEPCVPTWTFSSLSADGEAIKARQNLKFPLLWKWVDVEFSVLIKTRRDLSIQKFSKRNFDFPNVGENVVSRREQACSET
jgi:hypothetical protein